MTPPGDNRDSVQTRFHPARGSYRGRNCRGDRCARLPRACSTVRQRGASVERSDALADARSFFCATGRRLPSGRPACGRSGSAHEPAWLASTGQAMRPWRFRAPAPSSTSSPAAPDSASPTASTMAPSKFCIGADTIGLAALPLPHTRCFLMSPSFGWRTCAQHRATWVDSSAAAAATDMPRAVRVDVTLARRRTYRAMARVALMRYPVQRGARRGDRDGDAARRTGCHHRCDAAVATAELDKRACASSRPGASPGAGDGRRAVGATDRQRECTRRRRRTSRPTLGLDASGHAARRTARSPARSSMRRVVSTSTILARAPPSPAPLLARLQRLFTILALPPSLLSAIIDWIDVDDRITTSPAARRTHGTRRSHGPVSPPIIRYAGRASFWACAVRPVDVRAPAAYIHALDAPTKINVNTAPAEVLDRGRRRPRRDGCRHADRRARSKAVRQHR